MYHILIDMCFRLLVIVNNAALNMDVHISFCDSAFRLEQLYCKRTIKFAKLIASSFHK